MTYSAVSPWWGLIAAAVFFIGLAKSGFGSGLGLLAVPVITLAAGHLPGRTADAGIALMAPLLVVGDLVAVWQYRRAYDGAVVGRLLAGSAVGLAVGGGLLVWFQHLGNARVVSATIQVEIGLESVCLVGLYGYTRWRGADHRTVREPLRGRLTGAVAGVSSTLAHGAGPIVANYLLPLKLDRRRFVGTSAAYFFLLNTAKLPLFAATGEFHRASPAMSLRLAPLVLLGAAAGTWVNRRMSDRLFVRFVYGTTFALGVYLLVVGGRTLAGG